MSSQNDTTEAGSEDFLKAPRVFASSLASDMAAAASARKSGNFS